MLAVTLVMYALSTFDWALDIHFVRNDLKVYLLADLAQPPRNEDKRMKVDAALKVAQSITNNICVSVWLSIRRNVPDDYSAPLSSDSAERHCRMLESVCGMGPQQTRSCFSDRSSRSVDRYERILLIHFAY